MSIERGGLTDDEKQAAMMEAFAGADDDWLSNHPVGANYKMVVFTSRREFKRDRRSPKTVVLVSRNGGSGIFYEYKPGEMRGEIDDLAQDIREILPAGADPYEVLVDWIESNMRRK